MTLISSSRVCQKCRILSLHTDFNYYIKHNLKKHISNSVKNFSFLNERNIDNHSWYWFNTVSKQCQSRHIERSIVIGTYCTQSHELENLINNPKFRTYMKSLMLEYKNDLTSLSEKLLVVDTSRLLERKAKLEDNISSLEEIAQSENKDSKGFDELTQLVEEERKEYLQKIKHVEIEILKSLIPKSPLDNCNGVVMEISAGVGGQEAMLFAKDLYTMYCGYIQYRGWTMEVADCDKSDLGGIRHASILVYGSAVYKCLNTEGGVHRVQRIPVTEKSGRVHTSTVTVAVFPQPEDVDIVLNDKDLKIETKRASGAGGQHVNTTDSAVRVVHVPSGIVVECQQERSQQRNKDYALRKLKAKLYEKQINAQMSEIKSSVKHQVGTSGRSEKIRTYNFNQDRITDHRLSSNVHNLTVFIQGGEPLQRLVEQLWEVQQKQRIDEFIQSIVS